MTNLGVMYYNGEGVDLNYKEAVRWARQAAEAGQAQAMANLGVMYENGHGVLKDYVKAVEWYRKAAEMGLIDSMISLGQIYSSGGFGLEKDDIQAARWFLKGAEAGSARAMYHLGTFYESGRGGTQDNDKAQHWFRKSAETGDEWVIDRLRRPSAKFKDKLSRIVNAAYDQFKGWGKPGSETEDGYGNVEWVPILSLSNGIGSNKLRRRSYDGENHITYDMVILIPKDLKQTDELWNEYFAEIEEATKSLQGFRVRSKSSEEKYLHIWKLEKTGFLGMALDQVTVCLTIYPAMYPDPGALSILISRFPD